MASTKFAPPQLGTRRPFHRGRRARVASQPPAALPSPVELGAAASGSQATLLCGASLAGSDRFFSLGRPHFLSWAALTAMTYDIASLVGSLIAMPCLSAVLAGFERRPPPPQPQRARPYGRGRRLAVASLLGSLPDAMPCRTSLDDFCGRLVGLELRSWHCVRRTRPRLATARKGAMAWSRRRAPALPHAACARRRERHSAGHLCAVSRPAPSHSSCALVSGSLRCVREERLSHAMRSARRRPGVCVRITVTYCSHVIHILAVISLSIAQSARV